MIIIRGKSGKSEFASSMVKSMDNPLVFVVGGGDDFKIDVIRFAEIEDCFRFFKVFKDLFENNTMNYTEVVFIVNVPKENAEMILRFEELERRIRISTIITVQDDDIDNVLLSQLGGW